MTQKRVVSAVISFWAFCAFLVSLRIPVNIKFVIVAIIDAVCFLTAAIANWNIHVTARHHAHQLQALQAQQVAQNVEIANVLRLKQSAYAAIGVFMAFLVCYLPHTCFVWVTTIAGEPSVVLKVVSRYTWTLMLP